ncbi:uncharacterized protein ACIBXB_014261 [Morphnus guianensis]
MQFGPPFSCRPAGNADAEQSAPSGPPHCWGSWARDAARHGSGCGPGPRPSGAGGGGRPPSPRDPEPAGPPPAGLPPRLPLRLGAAADTLSAAVPRPPARARQTRSPRGGADGGRGPARCRPPDVSGAGPAGRGGAARAPVPPPEAAVPALLAGSRLRPGSCRSSELQKNETGRESWRSSSPTSCFRPRSTIPVCYYLKEKSLNVRDCIIFRASLALLLKYFC